MPMGIVSDKDFNTELGKLNPSEAVPSDGVIKDIPHKGRSEGDKNVPDSLRKIIGETSEIHGREEAVKLGEAFGISPSSVSAYANGSHSTSSYDQQPNLGHINKAKERISKKAKHTLFEALKHITEEKLGNETSVKILSGVARDMSAIIKDMEPEQARVTNIDNSPKFIIYSPQLKREEVFDVVQTKE